MSEIKTIIDLTGNKQQFFGCMGCEISKGNLKLFGGKLFEDEYFEVMQDIELPINGFIIIAPKRHLEKFTELYNDEKIDLFFLIDKLLNILRKNKVAEEFNIIMEEKSGVHFHIWLMPKAKWMISKFGKVLKNIKAIQEYAITNMKTKENLKEIEDTCNLLKVELNK